MEREVIKIMREGAKRSGSCLCRSLESFQSSLSVSNFNVQWMNNIDAMIISLIHIITLHNNDVFSLWTAPNVHLNYNEDYGAHRWMTSSEILGIVSVIVKSPIASLFATNFSSVFGLHSHKNTNDRKACIIAWTCSKPLHLLASCKKKQAACKQKLPRAEGSYSGEEWQSQYREETQPVLGGLRASVWYSHNHFYASTSNRLILSKK